MVHGPTAIEVDAEGLNEVVSQMRWCNDSRFNCDFEITEVVVNSGTICHMLLDIVCHTVPSDPFGTIFGTNVIRQLDLQEIACTTLTIPPNLILQSVFSRPSKHGHVVTVHHKRVITRVVSREDQTLCCVICSP